MSKTNKQTNNLYNVRFAENDASFPDSTVLLILARDVETAAKKALRFLRPDRKRVKITEVKFRGTIDVF